MVKPSRAASNRWRALVSGLVPSTQVSRTISPDFSSSTVVARISTSGSDDRLNSSWNASAMARRRNWSLEILPGPLSGISGTIKIALGMAARSWMRSRTKPSSSSAVTVASGFS